MTGVALNELHCPTCGEQFLDLALHSDPDEFDIMQATVNIREVISPTEWYIVCPNSHKWTIKTIWRTINLPDRVLLGRFLGTE